MSAFRRETTLLLCGDVMLGRGVDQVLGHPGDPRLVEPHVHDARDYVALAEAASGPIPRPVDDRWPWGAALAEIEAARPAVLVVNLETAVTRDGSFDAVKDVHYRVNPANLGSLAAARPDVCVLANNHVLDFGVHGLEDTLTAPGRRRRRRRPPRPLLAPPATARGAPQASGAARVR